MPDDAIRDRLVDLGFSEAEASMYLVVLRRGETTVADIADATDISTRYVYERLDHLADRGVVDVLEYQSPTAVRARPPDEAISELVEGLWDLEAELATLYSQPDPPEASFDLLKSGATAEKEIRSLAADATEELVLALPRRKLDAVEAELRAAVDRGVLVVLLLGGDDEAAGVPVDCYSVLRVWDQDSPVMVAADVSAGLMAPAGFLTRAGDAEAVSVRQGQLVANIVGSFLGNYWPLATEVSVREPLVLPRTFNNFRHAAVEAAIQRRAGNPIRVEATVHEPGDDAETTVAGQVVDARQGVVEPRQTRFPIEATLVVETDAGQVTVGGSGAFLEDYVAVETTLRPAE
ncbi:MAG: TrmB family transcriptional regulator sugar-binding domain-containing protein [Haloarculaceae archaeon]